jgi:hypothetical protein
MTIKWNELASKHLVGRTIVKAKWLSAKESKRLMDWDYQPLELFLDNGTILTPSADDECNNAGALFTNIKKTFKKKDGTIGTGEVLFPVFREYTR